MANSPLGNRFIYMLFAELMLLFGGLIFISHHIQELHTPATHVTLPGSPGDASATDTTGAPETR